MDELYDAFRDASLLIIASPLYFSHLPSPLKSIIDRCQVLWEYYKRVNSPSFNRWGTALLIGGSNYSNMFVPSIITLRHFFNSLRIDFEEENYILLPDINSKDDIKNDDITKKIKGSADYIKNFYL